MTRDDGRILGWFGDKGGYPWRDRRIVDYHMYRCPETGLSLRGPQPKDLEQGRFIACIGAAQTFGCLSPKPYPTHLGEALGLPVVNLGFGGAGASLFLSTPRVFKLVNRAALVVVQVMSGRSESNSLFETGGLEGTRRRSDGKLLSANAAYAQTLEDAALASFNVAGRRLHLHLRTPSHIAAAMHESCRKTVEAHRTLLANITAPKVLFYFSVRQPAYRARFHSLQALFSDFPHFVTQEMIDEVSPRSDRYVKCVSRRGLPQKLFDRETGRPAKIDLKDGGGNHRGFWSENPYYPSPEMHEDAARALAPACKAVLNANELASIRTASASS